MLINFSQHNDSNKHRIIQPKTSVLPRLRHLGIDRELKGWFMSSCTASLIIFTESEKYLVLFHLTLWQVFQNTQTGIIVEKNVNICDLLISHSYIDCFMSFDKTFKKTNKKAAFLCEQWNIWRFCVIWKIPKYFTSLLILIWDLESLQKVCETRQHLCWSWDEAATVKVIPSKDMTQKVGWLPSSEDHGLCRQRQLYCTLLNTRPNIFHIRAHIPVSNEKHLRILIDWLIDLPSFITWYLLQNILWMRVFVQVFPFFNYHRNKLTQWQWESDLSCLNPS